MAATGSRHHPGAYCGAPVTADRQATPPWTWPGKGQVTVCPSCGYDHPARPNDLPKAGNRCRDCGQPITWIGPSHDDWIHTVTSDNPPTPTDAG